MNLMVFLNVSTERANLMKAVHGYWCNTRTFPTRCHDCGAKVFYFSCDCGSRVFFDRLGKPWQPHRCAERGYGQGWLKLELGSQIIPIDKFHETIEREYRENVQQETENGRHNQTSWTLRQDPHAHNCRTTKQGVIKELIWDADIFKKAGVTASFGIAMLGKYAKGKLAQITIHTGALAEGAADNSSYTFFVGESVVKRLKLIKDDFVTAKLRGIVLSARHPIWVCDKLTGL